LFLVIMEGELLVKDSSRSKVLQKLFFYSYDGTFFEDKSFYDYPYHKTISLRGEELW
jgi:hypothetical protein